MRILKAESTDGRNVRKFMTGTLIPEYLKTKLAFIA